jgi:hypothetical protein
MALQELHAYTAKSYLPSILRLFKFDKTRRTLKPVTKLLIFALLIQICLGMLNPTSASGASKLTAISSGGTQVTSGKFLLAPVSTSGAANPQSALTLIMSAKNDYFYLKNFGNYTLRYFSMTQTLASTTIRYCVNQNFKGGSYTKCADNSNPFTVGNTLNLGRIQFNTPLTASNSYQFSAVSTISGNNTISVSISRNDLLNPSGTVFNS